MTIICPCCGEEICDEFKHCPECRFDIEQYNKEHSVDVKASMLAQGKEAYAKAKEMRRLKVEEKRQREEEKKRAADFKQKDIVEHPEKYVVWPLRVFGLSIVLICVGALLVVVGLLFCEKGSAVLWTGMNMVFGSGFVVCQIARIFVDKYLRHIGNREQVFEKWDKDSGERMSFVDNLCLFVYVRFLVPSGKQNEQRLPEKLVCSRCGTVVEPSLGIKESFLGLMVLGQRALSIAVLGVVAFVLSILFGGALLVPVVVVFAVVAVYQLFLKKSKPKQKCPKCGSDDLIPVSTPVGQRLVKGSSL